MAYCILLQEYSKVSLRKAGREIRDLKKGFFGGLF